MLKKVLDRFRKKTAKQPSNLRQLEALAQCVKEMNASDVKYEMWRFNKHQTQPEFLDKYRTNYAKAQLTINFDWAEEIPHAVVTFRKIQQQKLDPTSLPIEEIQRILTVMYKIDLITGDGLFYAYAGGVLSPITEKLIEALQSH